MTPRALSRRQKQTETMVTRAHPSKNRRILTLIVLFWFAKNNSKKIVPRAKSTSIALVAAAFQFQLRSYPKKQLCHFHARANQIIICTLLEEMQFSAATRAIRSHSNAISIARAHQSAECFISHIASLIANTFSSPMRLTQNSPSTRWLQGVLRLIHFSYSVQYFHTLLTNHFYYIFIFLSKLVISSYRYNKLLVVSI